jgi:hypothetical protein
VGVGVASSWAICGLGLASRSYYAWAATGPSSGAGTWQVERDVSLRVRNSVGGVTLVDCETSGLMAWRPQCGPSG